LKKRGSASIIGFPVPSTIGDGSPGDNDNILVFDELQGVTVDEALAAVNPFVGGSSLIEGSVVDSHLVFLNRESGSSLLSLGGSVTFSGEILAVFGQVNGTDLDATDSALGLAGVTYESFDNRGLETGGANADGASFVAGSDTLILSFLNVTQPGDWIRVVTAAAPVPVPAPILLFGTGLLAFGAMRRRQAK